MKGYARPYEFRSRLVMDAIYNVPAAAADEVAALLLALADEMRARGRQYREDQARKQRAKDELATLRSIPVMIGQRMQNGMSLEEAKADVRFVLDAPPETVDWYWTKYQKDRIEVARRTRRRQAHAMKKAGYSNAEIARALNVTVRTVARDLRPL